MTKFVAIGLLVLVGLAGLPVGMDSGAMMTCPSCPSAHSGMMFSICLAVLAIILGFSLTVLGRASSAHTMGSSFVISAGLFRPPRAV